MINNDTIKFTDDIFFEKNEISKIETFDCVNNTLKNSNGGELYFESTDSETLFFTDSRIQNISQNSSQGFGLRSINDDKVAFSSSDNLSFKNILNASKTVKSITNSNNGNVAIYKNKKYSKPIYTKKNPLINLELSKKIVLLEKINDFARKADNRVVQVSISLSGSFTSIQILKKDFENHADVRPLIKLNIQIVVESNNKKSFGSSGYGGRTLYDEWVDEKNWKPKVKEALKLAILNLDSQPAPAGELPVF
jgi:Predicted Zn-dependent proteases and their inactivated homologs